jgi:hypothetical protein
MQGRVIQGNYGTAGHWADITGLLSQLVKSGAGQENVNNLPYVSDPAWGSGKQIDAWWADTSGNIKHETVVGNTIPPALSQKIQADVYPAAPSAFAAASAADAAAQAEGPTK